MRRLRDLLCGVNVLQADVPDTRVGHVTYFAHEVRPGGAYVACDLPWMDGRRAVRAAAERGAAVIILDDETEPTPATECGTVVVADARKAYSTICANFYGHPERRLSLYAVTGTKGKTSTCHLIESIFRSAGLQTALISTVVRRIGGREVLSGCTTPDPAELYRLLNAAVAAGVTHVVLEVSSIGIAEERVAGLCFDGAVYTNIGHEHLEYHGGMENYRAAKRRLFTEYAAVGGRRTVCVVNADDEFGAHLAGVARGEVVTYGVNGEVGGDALTLDGSGIYGEVGGIPVRSSLLGAHNVYNILGAVALCRGLGLPPEAIAEGVAALGGIPGRLERVSGGTGVDVFIDYAHTPESLFGVLASMRELFAGRRLVSVLGCSGGSDRWKRPVMAKIAVAHSDACVFTSDNPREESPAAIAEEMLGGVRPAEQELFDSGRLAVLLDRREAIHRGFEMAGEDGVLLILGKGHERSQVVGRTTTHFEDRAVALEAMRRPRASGDGGSVAVEF